MTLKDRHPFAVDQLNQMQRYLGEEMIEDYHTGELTRRQMLKRLLGICGSAAAAAALLAACGEGTATHTGRNRRRRAAQRRSAGRGNRPPQPPLRHRRAGRAIPQRASHSRTQPTAAAAAASDRRASRRSATSPLSVAADDPDVTGIRRDISERHGDQRAIWPARKPRAPTQA